MEETLVTPVVLDANSYPARNWGKWSGVGFVECAGLFGAKYPGWPGGECLLLSRAVMGIMIGLMSLRTSLGSSTEFHGANRRILPSPTQVGTL